LFAATHTCLSHCVIDAAMR